MVAHLVDIAPEVRLVDLVAGVVVRAQIYCDRGTRIVAVYERHGRHVGIVIVGNIREELRRSLVDCLVGTYTDSPFGLRGIDVIELAVDLDEEDRPGGHGQGGYRPVLLDTGNVNPAGGRRAPVSAVERAHSIRIGEIAKLRRRHRVDILSGVPLALRAQALVGVVGHVVFSSPFGKYRIVKFQDFALVGVVVRIRCHESIGRAESEPVAGRPEGQCIHVRVSRAVRGRRGRSHPGSIYVVACLSFLGVCKLLRDVRANLVDIRHL